MKIELNNNKIFYKNGSSVQEIHPFWLRERANGEKYLDKKTQQRLFDPTSLNVEIAIKSARINNDLLEIDFNDGVNSKLNIEKIAEEFSKEDEVIYGIEKVKWNSSFTDFKKYKYSDELFETQEMYDLLLSFYKYGFVIIQDVPTEDNFLVKFANKVGSVRRTNFGEHFNVKSIPSPNDLAYTSLPLAPHTDNPYRNPVPCIQLLHCIINEVSGGLSTLVDGYTVTEDLKTAISDAKSGQAEIRNDKDGNIGVSIGKKSFEDQKLVKNFNAIIDVLEKEKTNNTLKGDLIKQTFMTSTMGVSYKVKLEKNI